MTGDVRAGGRQRPRPAGREPYGRGEPTPGGRPRFPWAGGGPPLRARPAPASREKQRLTGHGRAVRVQQWTNKAGPRVSGGHQGAAAEKGQNGVSAGEKSNGLGIRPWSDTGHLLRHALPDVLPMSVVSARDPNGAHATG
jgi:hypothetical protein